MVARKDADDHPVIPAQCRVDRANLQPDGDFKALLVALVRLQDVARFGRPVVVVVGVQEIPAAKYNGRAGRR